jgi:hypothetical protein
VTKDKPIRLKLTKPGKWKLRLYYEKGNSKAYVSSTHDLDIVVASKRKAVVMSVDAAALEEAQTGTRTGGRSP